MNHDKARKLAVIIIKIKLRRASPGEREELLAWLDEEEGNRRLYRRVIRGEALGEHFRLEDSALASLDVDRVAGKIARVLIARRRARVGWIAAACVAGALALSLAWFVPSREVAPVVAGERTGEPARARLVLPSGEEVNLERDFPRDLMVATTRISNDTGRLQLLDGGTTAGEEEAVWCRVMTSTGGQYHVRLQDGTGVWLNAESEMEFPSSYGRGERVVRLKGEAFFEVEALEGRPFVVETREVSTRVLGTSFNVHAYEEEGRVAVTLLSGSVEVEAGDDGRATRLVPGTAAVWTRATGALERRETRATDAIAWRDGAFIFTGEKLVQVTRALTRWHGVRFVYPDEGVEGLLFTGRVNMEEALPRVLESITIAGGPSFRVVDETVYVLK